MLAFLSHIIKVSPSSDISVIWIDIWNSQRGSKGRTLINYSFNFGQHTAIVWETVIYLWLLTVTIASTRNTQNILVTLKVLDIKNMMVYTEWRITDSWFSISRPIPSLTLLKIPLQLVHLVLTLSSVWTTKEIILLIITSIYSSIIVLTSNSTLTRLLNYTLNKPTTVL